MLRSILVGLAFFLALSATRAQEEKGDKAEQDKAAMKKLLAKAEEEYRLFFKRPDKAYEFWAAVKFELSLGKFDLAGLHLKGLLEKEPKEEADRDLVKIENLEGMTTFLARRNVKKWSDYEPFQKEAEESVEKLIDRVTKAVDTHLADPARLAKFIKQLDAPTDEERAFALVQLQQAKERAVPYLVKTLRDNPGNRMQARVYAAMLKLDSEIVPALLEVFKANDAKDARDNADLRLLLLDLVRRRDDRRAVPYLWYLSEAKEEPQAVRERARQVLSSLRETDISRLPPATVALTRLAEDYYGHRVRFQQGKAIRVWPWDGSELATKAVELTPHQAEEFFGLRYAREALDLMPAERSAQIVLLSLTLERAFEKELDQFLLKPTPPALHDLLATIDGDLLTTTLERALDEHKVAVALPLLRALGERGETRAAQAGPSGPPRGVVRALYAGDRRVQYAAARAMLKMPATPSPVAAERIVDILRRGVAGDGTPRVLAAYVVPEQAAALRDALKKAGYEAVVVRNMQEGFDKLHASTDFDLVLLHKALPTKELPFALTPLRADPAAAGLPVLVVTGKERQDEVERIAGKYRLVTAVPDVVLAAPDELKTTLDARLKDAQGAKLSVEERKEMTKASLDTLWRMARGEIGGYDVRPVQDAAWAALRAPDTATEAVEILGRLPGSDVQQRLASLVVDPARAKLRVPAAQELNRHVHQFGLLLPKRQLDALRTAYQTADDAALKAQLALVVGVLPTTPRVTGTQLSRFRPDAPAPEKEKKEEEKKAP